MSKDDKDAVLSSGRTFIISNMLTVFVKFLKFT